MFMLNHPIHTTYYVHHKKSIDLFSHLRELNIVHLKQCEHTNMGLGRGGDNSAHTCTLNFNNYKHMHKSRSIYKIEGLKIAGLKN
jgi:hypothetical protein